MMRVFQNLRNGISRKFGDGYERLYDSDKIKVEPVFRLKW